MTATEPERQLVVFSLHGESYALPIASVDAEQGRLPVRLLEPAGAAPQNLSRSAVVLNRGDRVT